MKPIPFNAETAKAVIVAALKRGPVHLFEDEADESARIVARSLLAHWPAIFTSRKPKEKKP